VKLTDCTDAERASAVAAFEARFAEMEQVLWCLSVNSRPGLLAWELATRAYPPGRLRGQLVAPC
jgi:hypothetical protein